MELNLFSLILFLSLVLFLGSLLVWFIFYFQLKFDRNQDKNFTLIIPFSLFSYLFSLWAWNVKDPDYKMILASMSILFMFWVFRMGLSAPFKT